MQICLEFQARLTSILQAIKIGVAKVVLAPRLTSYRCQAVGLHSKMMGGAPLPSARDGRSLGGHRCRYWSLRVAVQPWPPLKARLKIPVCSSLLIPCSPRKIARKAQATNTSPVVPSRVNSRAGKHLSAPGVWEKQESRISCTSVIWTGFSNRQSTAALFLHERVPAADAQQDQCRDLGTLRVG